MQSVVQAKSRVRARRRFFIDRSIEHLLDWAEPTIRLICREVWRKVRPRGLELEDLYQEGRIAVFQAAERIAAARNPRALLMTIVRRRSYSAIRTLGDWAPQPEEEPDPPDTD